LLITDSLKGSAVGQNTVSAPYVCDKSTTVPIDVVVETEAGGDPQAARPSARTSTPNRCEVMTGS
jgi:hypothetical protein